MVKKYKDGQTAYVFARDYELIFPIVITKQDRRYLYESDGERYPRSVCYPDIMQANLFFVGYAKERLKELHIRIEQTQYLIRKIGHRLKRIREKQWTK